METQCSVCRETTAKFACSCAFPPLPVCLGCLTPHMETEGTHTLTLIKKAATVAPAQVQGNEVCDGCHDKPAVRFCLCAVPLRKYCEDCDIAHYRKAPLLKHSEHPLSAYTAIASGRVPLEAFKKKQQFISEFQLRLGLELVNFDAFVNQVGEKFDQLLVLVTTKKQALLRDLQMQRTTLMGLLSTAQQEIEGKRYAEAFEVKNTLDGIILNGYQSASPPELKMFAGTADLEKVKGLLEKAVTYEVGSDLQSEANPLPIPVIKNNSLRLYDPSTLQASQTTLNQTTHIDHGTAYCYISKDTLLCCGGCYATGGVHNEVYQVNIRTSTAVKVASMDSLRSWLGIWNYRNESVYAFGGYHTRSLNTGERYGLATKAWTSLRNTLRVAKYGCSVCEHTGQLFISGADRENSIELFNPQSEAFTLLRSEDVRVVSILCSDGEGLYCIRRNTIEQISLANGPAAATFTVKAIISEIGSGHYWLGCPMKWNKGELISVLDHWRSPVGLFRFNPAKVQFTQIVAFAY